MTLTSPEKPRRRTPLYRRWKTLLTGLICFEIFFSYAGCANTMLLHPSTERIDVHGAVARRVACNGKPVEIWTARSPACNGQPPRAFVLEYCGNGSRAEEVIPWLVNGRWKRWPIEIWVVNYPGFGASAGRASLKAIPAVGGDRRLRRTEKSHPHPERRA